MRAAAPIVLIAAGPRVMIDVMDRRSIDKIQVAGYRIIRCDDYPNPRIKIRAIGDPNWKTLETGFPSKAARDRRFDELMNEPMTIND